MPDNVLRALSIFISLTAVKKCLILFASPPFSKYQKCHAPTNYFISFMKIFLQVLHFSNH